jgi:putative transposase
VTRPLDGIALLTYFRRLKFSKKTQDLLIDIRTSPPSRTPGARRGNLPIWYPSKKMQCIIKAESHKVEFAFLLHVEHDDNVLEVWDQPPCIQLE